MNLSPHVIKPTKYSDSKAERLEARVSAALKSLVQHAANLTGRSLTDFMISSLQEVSNRVIQEHEIIQLSLEDRKAFVKALLNPPKASHRLLRAKKRFLNEVEVKE